MFISWLILLGLNGLPVGHSFQGWTTTCKITSHRASTKYTSYPAPNLCFPSGLHRACTSTTTTANLVLRALSANSSHQFQGLTRQDTPSSYQPRAGEVKSLTGVSACSRGSCYRVNESHVSKIPPSKRASAKRAWMLPALGNCCRKGWTEALYSTVQNQETPLKTALETEVRGREHLLCSISRNNFPCRTPDNMLSLVPC